LSKGEKENEREMMKKYNLTHNAQRYSLKEKRVFENMIDYVILYESEEIGILNINVSKDSIFIRQVRIYDVFRRQGHANNIIKYLMIQYKKVRFCVATNSDSAICFWKRFLSENKYNHIRGEIYELIN
jgi:hypothetical protein